MNRDDIIKKILEKDHYTITSLGSRYKKITPTDKVAVFFNGKNWIIVQLNICLAYPVIYYDFWHEKENKIYTNTLLVCPITLRSLIYKEKIVIQDIIDNRLFLHSTFTDDSFFMDRPYTGHIDSFGKEKIIKSHVKRHMVQIMYLRNTFTIFTDPLYLFTNQNIDLTPIINPEYYLNTKTYSNNSIVMPISDKYPPGHPKSIVYIIQYFSHKKKIYKFIIIIPRTISNHEIIGYQYTDLGFHKFFGSYIQQYNNKRAYIYPMLYYMAVIMLKYERKKIIII